jgi:ABC-type multidrug transport system fused ATPase/permease subunit
MSDTINGSGVTEPAVEHYRALFEQCQSRAETLKGRDRVFGGVRLGLFAVALVLLGFAFFAELSAWGWGIGFLFLAAFLVAAILNEPVREAIAAEQRRQGVLARLLARVARDWDALDWRRVRRQLSTVQLDAHQRDVADDLDLLGKSSLFQFVSMAGTNVGVRTLARWLTQPASAEPARQRAAAVAHLAPRRDQRLHFYALAAHVGQSTGDPDEFIRWTQSDPWLKDRRWLLAWANLSAILAVAAILVLVGYRLVGLSPAVAQAALAIGCLIVVINVLVTTVMLGPVHQIFSVAMASRESVDEYRQLFEAARWLELETPPGREGQADAAPDRQSGQVERLRHLHETLVGDGSQSARVGMSDLKRVASLGSLRTSAATFLLYLPLQALGLWDVRVLRRLEAWQQRYREAVPGWFDAFGELEALMSLAAVRDEQPDWVFPEWQDAAAQDAAPRGTAEAQLTSTALGHPLLPDQARVCNDVAIGPSGTVLLVTGSNMSGKSTMLRSVGLNVALAGAGAPVCAAKLSLPSIELATSIRVRDDLAEGVSFYMAELKRLKGVVDRARRLADDPRYVSLFLLDEILQGTNSRERQIAVTQVLRHLIQCGAIGAISTHDLELADEPELRTVSEIVHFRETITPDAEGNEAMTFDYKMRTGVSPTTNALRLLEIVGLGESAS